MKYKTLIELFDERKCFDNSKSVRTGIVSIDNIIGHLKPGTITIIGGRPGMGKTSMVLDICHRNATRLNIPVAYFIKNYYYKDILERLINFDIKYESKNNCISSINYNISNAIDKLEQSPLFVYSYSDWKMKYILKECYEMRLNKGINLIVIEDIESFYKKSSDIDASLIFNDLKCIARELNIPIVVTTNLLTTVENRKIHIPRIADIPSIKQISGLEENIILLYRKRYYHPKADDTSVAIVYGRSIFEKPKTARLIWDDNSYMFKSLIV